MRLCLINYYNIKYKGHITGVAMNTHNFDLQYKLKLSATEKIKLGELMCRARREFVQAALNHTGVGGVSVQELTEKKQHLENMEKALELCE